jgi:hypothetical protein
MFLDNLYLCSNLTVRGTQIRNKIYTSTQTIGTRGSVVFKALCYKPEGRGFDT